MEKNERTGTDKVSALRVALVSLVVSISTTNLHYLSYATATVNRWTASDEKVMVGGERKVVTRSGLEPETPCLKGRSSAN